MCRIIIIIIIAFIIIIIIIIITIDMVNVKMIINITLFSDLIGLEDHIFPTNWFQSCNRTVCHRTVCNLTVG